LQSLQVFGEWRSTGKYLQVCLGSESRFRLQETFDVSKHPAILVYIDLFIVDYGIESSDNFCEKRPVGLLNEPKILFKATSFDHHLACPIVLMHSTAVEYRP